MEKRSSVDRPSGLSRVPAFVVLVIALSVSVVGCATKDSAWVHENLSQTENFHAGTSVLETPAFPDTGLHMARLRATAHSRGRQVGAHIELAVRAEFPDYSFLDRVSFSTSSKRAFPLEVEKREPVDCGTSDASLCNVYEHVRVKLSRDFLKSKRLSGFHAKLWGRRDSVVIRIPPEYIEALLARMENRPVEPMPASSGTAPASPAP